MVAIPDCGSCDNGEPQSVEEIVNIENTVFRLREIEKGEERVHGDVACEEEYQKSVATHLQIKKKKKKARGLNLVERKFAEKERKKTKALLTLIRVWNTSVV